MFGISLSDESPREYRDYINHDADLYGEVIMGMIRRGVFAVDDAREPFFLSAAHSTEDIAFTLEAFGDALHEAKA